MELIYAKKPTVNKLLAFFSFTLFLVIICSTLLSIYYAPLHSEQDNLYDDRDHQSIIEGSD